MELHPFRWVCLSRYAVALAVVAALPGCDAEQEDNVSLRCGDVEEPELDLDEDLLDEDLLDEDLEGPDASDEPNSEALEHFKGAPDLNCPECGSHWTITNGANGGLEDGIVVVYLDKRLGESITSLTNAGSLRYGRALTGFEGYILDERPLGGYIIPIGPFSTHEFEPADQPAVLRRESATLSIHHEKILMGLRLRYVNNETRIFEDPPFQ